MDLDLGRNQLEGTAPAGNDPRDGAVFAQLTEQMDKLTDIHAPGEPDWARVSTLAQSYLRAEAKDLAVTCWMTAAWFRLHGTSGLFAGFTVLNDLHQNHWEAMLPTRIRGRRNLVAWLIEWFNKALTNQETEQLQPLTPEDHAGLQDAWRALDAFLQEHDDDAPSLRALGAQLQNLPVVEAEPEPEAAAEASESAEVEAAPAQTPDIQASSPAPQPVQPAAPVAVPAPAKLDFAPPPVADAAAIQSAQALETAVEKHLDALRPLLDLGVASYPALPWPYLLNRTLAWSFLEVAPPASGGITRVPAPGQPDQDVLERLLGAASPDPATLLQFTESRLPLYRFWLDLNHHSWQALSRLPDGAQAAAVVAEETARLLARLPGLAELSFANEQPFAGPATRQWLAGLSRPAAASSGPAAQPSNASDTLTLATAVAAASAQTAAAHGLLAAALERLEATSQHLQHRIAVT